MLDASPRHHPPLSASDHFARGVTKLLRFVADAFFAKRYGHRAIVLETVAAVPGMVGATLTHLQSLRRMVNDEGWIRTLLDEAENERMHLMTFIEVAKPTTLERWLIIFAQWLFYLGFFVLYLVQGLGNVGGVAARLFAEAGARVVARPPAPRMSSPCKLLACLQFDAAVVIVFWHTGLTASTLQINAGCTKAVSNKTGF